MMGEEYKAGNLQEAKEILEREENKGKNFIILIEFAEKKEEGLDGRA